jgi:hypothetical protein
MVRFAAVAASVFLLASAGALAGSSGVPEYSDGSSAGQSQTHDPYAHGNGSLGTLNQGDMDHFLRDGEQRGSDAQDDADVQANIRGDAQDDGNSGGEPDSPYASTDGDSTIGRAGDSAVNANVARFNPADFVALTGVRGPDLVGDDVETKSGQAIGHVDKISAAHGRVASVTVDLDDGRSVTIRADKLRYNKKDAFLLTNLDQPELEQLASGD